MLQPTSKQANNRVRTPLHSQIKHAEQSVSKARKANVLRTNS